jgi:hypothetical protein
MTTRNKRMGTVTKGREANSRIFDFFIAVIRESLENGIYTLTVFQKINKKRPPH